MIKLAEMEIKLVVDEKTTSGGKTEGAKQTALLSKNLLKLGAVAAATGVLAKASPMFSANLKMIERSLFLFLRPIGNSLGRLFLPLSKGLLSLSIGMNKLNISDKSLLNAIESMNNILNDKLTSFDEWVSKNTDLSDSQKKDLLQLGDTIKEKIDNQMNESKKYEEDKIGSLGDIWQILNKSPPWDTKAYQPDDPMNYLLGRAKEEITSEKYMGFITKPLGLLTNWIEKNLVPGGEEKGDINFRKRDDLIDYLGSFFEGLDIDLAGNEELAKSIQESLEVYLAEVFNDPQAAKEIMQATYNRWVYETLGDSKTALKSTGNKPLFEYGSNKFVDEVLGLKGFKKPENSFFDMITGTASEAVSSTAKEYDNMDSKAKKGYKDYTDSMMAKLERFTIHLPDGGSYNPFKGLLKAVSIMPTPSNIFKSITGLFSKKVNDAIITKDGKVIETAPDDNIFATKSSSMSGANISTMNVNISIENYNSEMQLRTLAQKVSETISREMSYMG